MEIIRASDLRLSELWYSTLHRLLPHFTVTADAPVVAATVAEFMPLLLVKVRATSTTFGCASSMFSKVNKILSVPYLETNWFKRAAGTDIFSVMIP